MKSLSGFWKVICATIATTLTGIFFILACDYHRTYHKEAEVSETTYYSDNCVGLRYDDGTFCVKNVEEKRITISKLDWAVRSWGKDSLEVFAAGSKRGYFNCLTGEVAIPLQYEKAWIFSEGLACVKKGDVMGPVLCMIQPVSMG